MKIDITNLALAGILAVGLTHLPMHGAPPTGSLGGEVTDPSGAVVPGAKVFILSGRGSETVSTDDNGRYVVTGLTPGNYEVLVSSDGFAPLDRPGLKVSAGARTEMDAPLDLAVLKQSITISAD